MKQKIIILSLFVVMVLLSSYGFLSHVKGYGTNDPDSSCQTADKTIVNGLW